MTISSKEKQRKLFKLICKIISSNGYNAAKYDNIVSVAAKRELYSSRSAARRGIKNVVANDKYPLRNYQIGMVTRTDLNQPDQ